MCVIYVSVYLKSLNLHHCNRVWKIYWNMMTYHLENYWYMWKKLLVHEMSDRSARMCVFSVGINMHTYSLVKLYAYISGAHPLEIKTFRKTHGPQNPNQGGVCRVESILLLSRQSLGYFMVFWNLNKSFWFAGGSQI